MPDYRVAELHVVLSNISNKTERSKPRGQTVLAWFVGMLAFLFAGPMVSAFGYQAQPSGQSAATPKDLKLSGPLTRLTRVFRQVGSAPTVLQGRSEQEPLFASLPKELADLRLSNQMRISERNEVQVYIELTEVTPNNLDCLRALGITIEQVGQPHPDKSQHEVFTPVPTVQALLPLSVIDAAKALGFVRYIRLPDYAIRNSGSVDTQGDSILQADVTRSTTGLDGTGVRVGVISDGIGGIFAGSCTTCVATSAVPSPITLMDLPASSGTRSSTGILTSVSGGIIAKSFYPDGGNLESCFGTCSTSGNVGAEGTAMLEIIHDLAPGAQLYFANGDPSMNFEAAVDYLAANTDVLVTDISYLTPPFDGTSAVSANMSATLNNNANPLRMTVASVGNYAQNHYSGTYTASGTDGLAITGYPGQLHLFAGSGNVVTTPGATADTAGLGQSIFDPVVVVPPGQQIQVYLAWNDPSGASLNDYDLFLVPLTCSGTKNSLPLPPCTIAGPPVTSSVNPQTGSQDPTESLAYTNNSSSPSVLGVVIQNISNAAAVRTFDLFVHGYGDKSNSPNHNFVTPTGSVQAVSDAGGTPVSVTAVGAINQAQCPSAANCLGTVEAFSSQGPTQVTPQSPVGRNKPDVVAVDNVCITGAGGFGNGPATNCPPSSPATYTPQAFGGTSAAAPHVAAIAALTLQSAPCLLAGAANPALAATARQNLRSALLTTAIPLAGVASGPVNNIEGSGLVNALAAVNSTLPTATAGTSQTVNATSSSGAPAVIVAAGSDPNSCPLTAVQWTGSCGSGTATGSGPGLRANISCPIGVDTVSISVSNNGRSFSQPTATPYTVIVTDFTLSASPPTQTVAAGIPVQYAIAASATPNGPFSNPVALACTAGLPPGATCSFSAVSITPGNTTVNSTMTVFTTGVAAAATPTQRRRAGSAGAILWSLLLFPLAFFRRRKRGRLALTAGLLGMFSCAVLLSITSCGTTQKAAFTPTTYTITVAGTSNQLQHTTTVSLSLQ